MYKFLILFLIGGGLCFFVLNIESSYIVEVQGSNAQEAKKGTFYAEKKLNSNDFENNNSKILVSNQFKFPPQIVRGLYATGWSAGSENKLNQLISVIKKNNLNSIVIDIKDYSGELSYKASSSKAYQIGALNNVKILDINKVIQKLHNENIYVIGRITVFQDPIFAQNNSSQAVKNKLTGQIWKDRKGLSWVDPQSQDFWNYIIEISQDAWRRGFDELNFDYIRFPSDGDLNTISYPIWDEKISKQEAIRNFYKYLRENLQDIKISADVFGLTTISQDDLGIGQIIEDNYAYFDVVCPMIYPSHFYSGTFGYKNPAEYPYEVIKKSLEEARLRLEKISSSSNVVLRPWLQVFDLGAKYDKKMINLEVKAVEEVLGQSKYFGGYLFWDPENNYLNLDLKNYE